METIETMDELLKNTETLETYIRGSLQQEFALDLVKNGICFVVVKNAGKTSFYPSRFIGYKNNNREAHLDNDEYSCAVKPQFRENGNRLSGTGEPLNASLLA